MKYLKASSENIHLMNMIHIQINEALQKALAERYPNARLEKEVETATGVTADIVLILLGKRVAFEVKMSNFYDALGRTVLWAKAFEGVYLVIPVHILPSKETLTLMPPEIGVITFQVRDRSVEFKVARQSSGHQLEGLSTQIQPEITPQLPKPVRTSLVSPKALRVARYLISHRQTTQVEIARETRVSTGMVNKVVSALVDRELVSYRGKDLVVFDVWRLVNEIAWSRPLKSLKKKGIYVIHAKSTEDVEARLVQVCNETKTRYAFTAFSGASRYIGYGMRYDSVQAYVEEPTLILERLGQGSQKTSEGITLEIFSIDNWDIIEEAKPIGGSVVCSAVQLVLDLVSYGGVGRDWAVKLYEATVAKKE